MGSVIGDILPMALGVAISPVPIIAVILMLLAPRARAASVAFMLGWVIGVVVVVGAVTFLVQPAGSSDPDDPSLVASSSSSSSEPSSSCSGSGNGGAGRRTARSRRCRRGWPPSTR